MQFYIMERFLCFFKTEIMHNTSITYLAQLVQLLGITDSKAKINYSKNFIAIYFDLCKSYRNCISKLVGNLILGKIRLQHWCTFMLKYLQLYMKCLIKTVIHITNTVAYIFNVILKFRSFSFPLLGGQSWTQWMHFPTLYFDFVYS